MKVELDKLRIAKSAITDNIYVGIPDKDNITWKESKDITSDFLKAIIEYGANKRFSIKSKNDEYEVIVINKKTHEVDIRKRVGKK